MQGQSFTPIKNQLRQTQLGTSCNQKSIRRSESDRRSLRLTSSNHQQIYPSSRFKMKNESFNKRFKTEEVQELLDLNEQKKSKASKEQQKNERFHDDHYNTQSLAELLDFKNDVKEGKYSQRKTSEVRISMPDDDEQINSKDQIPKKDRENFQGYIKGTQTLLDLSLKKRLEDFKLKIYSHEDELQNIKLKRFRPENDNEKRMEDRYWKGQQKIVQNSRTIKQFTALMKEYQLSKKKVLQESKKKYQRKKVWSDQKISRISSLPKLVPHTDEVPSEQRQPNRQVEKKVSKSLSQTRFDSSKKKFMKKECIKDIHQQQSQNVEQIEKVLKKKGINLPQGSVRKGIAHMKTLPDERINGIPDKKLLSNPIYKKYPL